MAGGYVKKKKEPYDQKTAVLKPEEQAMREENLVARENFQYDAMRHLSAAVSLRAISDYRKMMRKLLAMEQADRIERKLFNSLDSRRQKKAKPILDNPELDKLREDIQECEDFFDSEMFTCCTGFANRHDAIRKIMRLTPEKMDMIERRLKRA